MKFKKLGNTDLKVSLICLGTMTWGTQNSEKDAFEQMDYSTSQGVNFFDTAELYSVPPTADSYGKTEKMIGNWFEKRKKREKIILASKVAGHGCEWIRGGGNNFTEKKIGEAINESFVEIFSALSSGVISILYELQTGPVSNFSSIFIILIPVSFSKFIIDLWIGAAPLHFGRRDAWILINPFLAKLKNSFGIIWP